MVRTQLAQSPVTEALGALSASLPTTQAVLLGPSLDPLSLYLLMHNTESPWSVLLMLSFWGQIRKVIQKPPWWSSDYDVTFQGRVCEFHPWSGSWDPTCLGTKNPDIKKWSPSKNENFFLKKQHTTIFEDCISIMKAALFFPVLLTLAFLASKIMPESC